MKRAWILALLFGLAVMLAGCQAAAQNEAGPTVQPQAQEQIIEAFGTVRCREALNILLNFPVTVKTVHVREGQNVQKGDILATVRLDKAQIEMKKLQLTGEQKVLARLEKEMDDKKGRLISGKDPDILKLDNDRINAAENYDRLAAELAGKKKLAAAGSATQKEVEVFQRNIDAAEKAMEDIEFTRNSLEHNRDIEIQGLESEIIMRKNSIALLQQEIDQLGDKTKSEYLFEGNIICSLDRAVVDGAFISNGDMPPASIKLFSLLDLNTQIVEARIPEEFIKDVKVGMEARIIPLADKSLRYIGIVTDIAKKAQQQNGETNVLVEIELEAGEDFLIPDFNVDVEIPYETR